MNVLSLFDGMSCGQIALNRGGHSVRKYFAAEIKEHGITVTMDNFPNTIQIGDVTKVSFKNGILKTENGDFDIGKIDLLIGGSPCQDFSKANKERAGLEGIKSSLFFHYKRIKEELLIENPKLKWLLENVAMKPSDYQIVSEHMETYPVNINSELVSAQMRDRFYWTNIGPESFDLFGFRRCEIPQPKDKNIMLKDIIESGYTERLKARCLLEGDSRPHSPHSPHKSAHRYFNTGFTTIITRDEQTFLRVKEATKIGFVDIGNGEGVDLSYPTSQTRRGRLMKFKSNCLLRNNEYFIFQEGDLRYFTQTELERLQTVPEGYTKSVSRNDAACLLGDGWTIDVIVHILSFLPPFSN